MALKKIPFLSPKAPPYRSDRHQVKAQSVLEEERTRKGKTPFGMLPTGPRADRKTLKALSGNTPQETVSRFGRATRRQNKEFSAQIHPISGRMEGMVRGDYSGTHMPFTGRKSQDSMYNLARGAKSPAVAERAMANLMGQNPNIAGPKRLYAHNHPSKPGNMPRGIKRSYPSAQDTALIPQLPGYKGVVTSHQPGPRGAKKTKAVYFGAGPEKMPGKRLRTKRRDPSVRALKGTEGDRAAAQRVMEGQDLGTQPSIKFRSTQEGTEGRRSTARLHERMRRAARKNAERNDAGELKSWDDFMREKTGTRRGATNTGIHTREALYKRLRMSAFGVVH